MTDHTLSFSQWPSFDQEQLSAVEAVLRSGKISYWTGNEGRAFEEEYAKSLGVKHAVAVANGTVAIELALMALGIGAGDEVIVPSRTFIGTASAVVARGARPIVADIDATSQNITADTIKENIGPQTKAVIAVHLGGWPCDMNALQAVTREKNLYLIEDCAQAHGAFYKGQPVGSFGDLSAFSFCQDKIISTGGEGGLVATDNTELWEKVWSYKDHGKNWDSIYGSKGNGSFRFVHDSFGTNFRMTEMQSVLGRIQLRRLGQSVKSRRNNAHFLMSSLKDVSGLKFFDPPSDCYHSYYRLYGLIDRDILRPNWTRDKVISEIQNEGIPVGSGSCGEIYREKAFEKFGPLSQLNEAHKVHESSIAFLVHPDIPTTTLQKAASVVRQVLKRAVKKSELASCYKAA